MGILSKDVIKAYQERQKASSISNYLKPGDFGEAGTTITLLGDENHAIAGYVAFLPLKDDPKKVKKISTLEKLSSSELSARAIELGCIYPPFATQKPFYAFTVWNYSVEAIQILEITQTSLITPLMENISDPAFDKDPSTYDFTFKRVTTGNKPTDVKYSVTPKIGERSKDPKVKSLIQSKFDEVIDKGYDINALFEGSNPFETEE